MRIYLAWLNDKLIDAFVSPHDADAAVEREKKRYAGEVWKRLPSGRWHSQTIARLEVEEREVK